MENAKFWQQYKEKVAQIDAEEERKQQQAQAVQCQSENKIDATEVAQLKQLYSVWAVAAQLTGYARGASWIGAKQRERKAIQK